LKAAPKLLLYACLSVVGLTILGFVGMLSITWWEYHLPSDQTARQRFEEHKVDFEGFAAKLRQDQRPRVINRDGIDDAFENDAREVPEYRDLMSRIGAKAVYVRPDGSIEFELWGFGCGICTDSFKGLRFAPIDSHSQYPYGGAPIVVSSLKDESLPKTSGAVADGIYVLPVDREWSIYRMQITN
jgi:hypothetical protein